MLKFSGYDWNLWLWWIVANSAGGTLGIAAATIVLILLNATLPGTSGSETFSMGTLLTAAPVFAILGLILGLMQWLVLRTVGESYGLWILATGAGWLLGYILGVLLLNLRQDQSSAIMSNLILLLVIGFFSGSGQWYILRTRFDSTDWWILATTIATIIGFAGFLVGAICGGVLTWAGAGALTGYVLLRITQPTPG